MSTLALVPRRDENAIRSAAYAHNVCLMTTITGAAAAVHRVVHNLLHNVR